MRPKERHKKVTVYINGAFVGVVKETFDTMYILHTHTHTYTHTHRI